jgi:hypothetical protein
MTIMNIHGTEEEQTLLEPAQTSRHGRMRGRRSTRAAIALTLLVLFVSAVGPTAADANSLLSGYGGPGQGNQAILGAALVGGRSGGGSTGGGSTSGGSGGESFSGLAGADGEASGSHSSEARANTGGSARAGAASGGRLSATEANSGGAVSTSGSSAYPHRSGRSASQAESSSSSALGLSGADVLYILLALGVLILTAVLTRRLARQPG